MPKVHGNDNAYKNLFSHPQMVEELLISFVHEDWISEVDFKSLEKVSGSYVTDELRDREDDIVWRVRIGKNWIYLYILLEFQSTVDDFMALRLLTYTGLLYQDLIKSSHIKAKQKLPPVFPLVLYNGDGRWNAATEFSLLLQDMPAGLKAYTPSYRYLVIDEGGYADTELLELRNVVSALFQLEHSRDVEAIKRVFDNLVEWLTSPETATLRRAFVHWLKRVFLPKQDPNTDYEAIDDLMEVKVMLENRLKEWQKQWKAEGKLEGKLEGIQEGVRAAAIKAIRNGLSIDAVSSFSGLSRKELEKIRSEIEN
jgi:predicted transposase/invertase (TIGR01784 family)